MRPTTELCLHSTPLHIENFLLLTTAILDRALDGDLLAHSSRLGIMAVLQQVVIIVIPQPVALLPWLGTLPYLTLGWSRRILETLVYRISRMYVIPPSILRSDWVRRSQSGSRVSGWRIVSGASENFPTSGVLSLGGVKDFTRSDSLTSVSHISGSGLILSYSKLRAWTCQTASR